MKIKEITWRHRYDFQATMKCEFCDHEQVNNYGYDDHNYHANVIPNMKCEKCQKKSTDEAQP